jgi:hypothetical protein
MAARIFFQAFFFARIFGGEFSPPLPGFLMVRPRKVNIRYLSASGLIFVADFELLTLNNEEIKMR